jgi:hypothetical protein
MFRAVLPKPGAVQAPAATDSVRALLHGLEPIQQPTGQITRATHTA